MALQQSDLDALESALASGELTVEYDNKRTTFRSVAELVQAIAYVRTQIAASAPVTQSFASFSKD